MAKPTRRYPQDKKPDKQGFIKGDMVRLLPWVTAMRSLYVSRPRLKTGTLFTVVKVLDIADHNGFPCVHIFDPETGNMYTGSYNRGFPQGFFDKDVFLSAVAHRAVAKKKGLTNHEKRTEVYDSIREQDKDGGGS